MTPQEMKAELRALGARIEAGLGAIFNAVCCFCRQKKS